MKLLKLTLAAALLAAPMALMAAAPAHAQIHSATDLSGQWRGVYAGEANQATEFHVTIEQLGPNIAGAVVETNTFAQAPVAFLVADLQGRAANGAVSFTKTYVDADANVSHSVAYEGRLSSNGRRITGSWRTGDLTGVFEMVR